MNVTYLFQVAVLLGILTLLAIALGEYMAKVFKGEFNFALENWIYKFLKIDKNREMDWKTYVFSLLILNIIGIIFLFVLQEIQHVLPLNPQNFVALRWDTALNTAVSFVTNTNWQAYSGEQAMSYLTQMLGMTVQNFLSAAVGIAAAIAFIRGFARKTTIEIGNFWVDLTRSIVYVLLPLAIILSIFLVSQGVIQNLNHYTKATTIQGQTQTIAQGPAASQVAIKVIGTNGGGFFNTNSAHPYENPNPMTDYLEILAFLIISAAFPFTFGIMINKRKQGWIIYISMMTLYLLGLGLALWSEFHGNPLLSRLGISHGINMEGKEVRFGILNSVVFGQSTTATSCGAVNAMHDSLMPITGMILMFNMMVGEVIFGGVGVGIIGMLVYAILTMFLVGLMIGRTPEIFGKKLEPYEMMMAVTILLLPCIVKLILGSIAITHGFGLSSLNNAGPHGMSEIIYTFASGVGNNGSAFAGLNANTPFYNLTMALAMLVGRFATIVPALAIAGSLVKKKLVPEEARFPTASLLFVAMLVSVVFIVGALTFFPVLVMGPFLEHLLIFAGKVF